MTLFVLLAEIRKLFKVLIQMSDRHFLNMCCQVLQTLIRVKVYICETLIWFVLQLNETYLINSTDKVAI